MSKIPLDQLHSKTSLGVQVKPLLPSESFEQKARALGAHRDDHYIFFLLQAGSGTMMVDLQEVRMEARQLFYILPGQVHYHIRTQKAEGWFVAVDRSLMPPGCRNIFEGRLGVPVPRTLSPAVLSECVQVLTLLGRRYAGGGVGGATGVKGGKGAGAGAGVTSGIRPNLPLIHSLVQSFLWLAADCYDDAGSTDPMLSRPAELCRQFKLLLAENIRTLKSPSGYASRLHVSTAYLNEAVKGGTGLPCSHWIKEEILMEAKRLLYHSESSVKEIAAELGYEDPAYFSRWFSRAVGMPALAFREASRGLSGR